MVDKNVVNALASWLTIKSLIERENIYADYEINQVDTFLTQQALDELNKQK